MNKNIYQVVSQHIVLAEIVIKSKAEHCHRAVFAISRGSLDYIPCGNLLHANKRVILLLRLYHQRQKVSGGYWNK